MSYIYIKERYERKPTPDGYSLYDKVVTVERIEEPMHTASDFDISPDGVLIRYKGMRRHVRIPASVVEIGERAFEGAFVESVNIPLSVKRVENRAFYNCPRLRSVVFEDNDSFDEKDGVAYTQYKYLTIAEEAFALNNRECPTRYFLLPRQLFKISQNAFAGREGGVGFIFHAPNDAIRSYVIENPTVYIRDLHSFDTELDIQREVKRNNAGFDIKLQIDNCETQKVRLEETLAKYKKRRDRENAYLASLRAISDLDGARASEIQLKKIETSISKCVFNIQKQDDEIERLLLEMERRADRPRSDQITDAKANLQRDFLIYTRNDIKIARQEADERRQAEFWKAYRAKEKSNKR